MYLLLESHSDFERLTKYEPFFVQKLSKFELNGGHFFEFRNFYKMAAILHKSFQNPNETAAILFKFSMFWVWNGRGTQYDTIVFTMFIITHTIQVRSITNEIIPFQSGSVFY